MNSIFSIEISFFEEVFFLPFFASFRESDSYLEYIPLRVDTHWDECSTGFFDFLSDSQYFLLRHEDESLSLGIYYDSSRSLVLGYMGSDEYRTSGVECDVGSLQVGTPIADALDLTPHEHYPSFELLDHFVVE